MKETEQDDLSICPLFFVYGTLKQGHWNNTILQEEIFLGEAVTYDKYVLGDVGFPYAFPAHTVPESFPESLLKPVRGELYQVSREATVRRLDRLEGNGSHYHRELIKTTTGDTCWMYHQLDFNRMYDCYKCDTTEEGEWEWNGN